MRFRDVVGQEKIKQQLRNFIDSGRMPHALMLTSPAGRGKLALAIAAASYLACEAKENGDSCGSCPTCQKFDKLIHPDLHFVFPVVKKGNLARKDVFSDHFIQEWRTALFERPYLAYTDWLKRIEAENRQGDINARECQEIIRKLSLKSFGGQSKILIVWKAELLGNNANRLLKLIEEPPDNTYILFLVEDKEFVLNTIISRFQVLALPPIDTEEIYRFLIKEFKLKEESARQISQQSDGSLIEAFSLINIEVSDPSKLTLEWFRICHQSNPEALMQWVSRFAGFSKEDQKQLLRYTLHLLRGLVQLQFMPKDQLNLTNHEIGLFGKLSNILDLDRIDQISELLSESLTGLERNMNPRILMMADSLQIGKVLRQQKAKTLKV